MSNSRTAGPIRVLNGSAPMRAHGQIAGSRADGADGPGHGVGAAADLSRQARAGLLGSPSLPSSGRGPGRAGRDQVRGPADQVRTPNWPGPAERTGPRLLGIGLGRYGRGRWPCWPPRRRSRCGPAGSGLAG